MNYFKVPIFRMGALNRESGQIVFRKFNTFLYFVTIFSLKIFFELLMQELLLSDFFFFYYYLIGRRQLAREYFGVQYGYQYNLTNNCIRFHDFYNRTFKFFIFQHLKLSAKLCIFKIKSRKVYRNERFVLIGKLKGESNKFNFCGT